MKTGEIVRNIFLIGGAEFTDPKDCLVYLLDFGELIMVDTGAGQSVGKLIKNMETFGFDPGELSTVILTHCHIDHVGGANELARRFGTTIVMHELDADTVETGDRVRTGASWYGVKFDPLKVDLRLTEREGVLHFASGTLGYIHTPGHTPGSMSLYADVDGGRVLFGQDIHGPFLKEFGSDMADWEKSMRRLLELNADILCEGHFGVYRSARRVKEYIEHYLEEYCD
ncbi:MAG TPA: MBL fold metallo-hydrolase [Syntrophorhabdaceae bacterium]|nr:MBL fold metallo-hydrolase [Syntrophorhabdaceae bacterium]